MRRTAIITAATVAGLAAMLSLDGCGSPPASASPDIVVTSRSNGKAVPNPRRGTFTKSAPGTYGYTTPGQAPDPQVVTMEEMRPARR